MATIFLQPDEPDAIDTAIYSYTSNTPQDKTRNYGTSSSFSIGWLSGGTPANPEGRALLKFDLSSVPTNANIISATLTLLAFAEDTTADLNIRAHRSLVQWYEGIQAGAVPTGEDGSTWDLRNHNGSVAWVGGQGGGAGSDYATTPTDTTLITSGAGYFDWDVTVDVQDFVDGVATNHGWWLLGDMTVGAAAAKRFRSSNRATASDRPSLTVVYSDVLTPIAASVVLATVTPTVIQSSASITPAPASMVLATVDPTVSATILPIPSIAEMGFSTDGPLVVEGSVSITPSPATFVFTTLMGGLGVAPPAASFVLVTTGPTLLIDRTIIPPAATFVWATNNKAGRILSLSRPHYKTPMPLLYLTDGTTGRGGILNRLNLLNCKTGYCLEEWSPAIAQYKGGGLFYDSPIAEGRRPILHRFQNAVEVFNLKAHTYDQNRLIAHLRELQNWVERSIEYWESPWASLPIYIVARGAYETNTRYAVIFKGDIPSISNPYQQPFFSHYSRSAILNNIQLTLERGHWQDVPPGESTCLPLGNARTWSWQTSTAATSALTGQIYSLVQANNGDILAGSGDAAKIFRSTDDGATWVLVQTLGSGSAWVRGLARDTAGNLYAAVGNGTSAQNGVWKSTNNGGTWTRILIAPATSQGYADIVTDIHGYIYAIGPSFASGNPNALLSYSNDSGLNWTNIGLVGGSTSYNNAAIIAGIGYFAANNQYQQVVRSMSANIFNPSPVSPQTMLPTNFGGSTGLDIEAYEYNVGSSTVLVEDENGRIISSTSGSGTQREILRGVLNGIDTQIWVANHQENLAGQFNFAQRSVLSGQTVVSLYADPYDLVLGPLSNNRTIWAGASNRIYRSQNRGYTWELVSTTPVGSVTAFLRTSSGRLIAASNAEVISVLSSFTYPPGSTSQNVITIGQEDTCTGALLGNKSNQSNITHVKVFDASGATYTDILPAASFPVNIYPSTPASGDILYIGAQTGITNIEIGPFVSAVFDIETVSSGLTILWEYWNGSAWTTLSLTKDNTDSFKTAGILSVHWLPSSNWATTTVNGVTGYWVRARITTVSSPIAPTQANQDIYSLTQSYVEIGQEEIDGDIPALAQIQLYNLAHGAGAYRIDKILIGFRSSDRGDDFNAFINISDQQQPFGVSVSNNLGSFSASPFTPTGRILSVTGPSINVWQTMASITLSTTIARDYYGGYRAFLRCKQVNGVAGQIRVRLRSVFGSELTNITTSKEDYTRLASSLSSAFELLDLGRVDIPTSLTHRSDQEIVDLHQLDVQINTSSITPTFYIVDLILIPIDEWAASFDGAGVSIGQYADLDSIHSNRTTIRGLSKWNDGRIISIFETIAATPIQFQVRQAQKIWVLCGEGLEPSGALSYPGISTLIKVNKIQRYLSMRGVA